MHRRLGHPGLRQPYDVAMAVLPPSDPALLEDFARSMRDQREAAGEPTIRQLAKTADYSERTISKVLKDRLQHSRRAVQAVAAALGADGEEWGRRWDALNLAPHPPIHARGDLSAIEGCPNPRHGRWCNTHDLHNRLYGHPAAGRFSPKTHPAVCSVDGCGRPYRARGLCKSHYDNTWPPAQHISPGSWRAASQPAQHHPRRAAERPISQRLGTATQ